MGELFAASEKRCKVMVMTGAALFGFLRGLDGRLAYRLYGMPADCKVIGTFTPVEAPGSIAFLLESKEWDVVPTDAPFIPEVKFEILTAVMPGRLEKPKPTLKALPPPQIARP